MLCTTSIQAAILCCFSAYPGFTMAAGGGRGQRSVSTVPITLFWGAAANLTVGLAVVSH